jgi:hypothetical protein
MSRHHYNKQPREIPLEELHRRAVRCSINGYPKQKWITFCEILLAQGYCVRIYMAKSTRSKYVHVSYPSYPNNVFKVRFSDHKPNKYKEIHNDCDFWVGVSNFQVHTTAEAIMAVLDYFEKEKPWTKQQTPCSTCMKPPYELCSNWRYIFHRCKLGTINKPTGGEQYQVKDSRTGKPECADTYC